MQSRYYDPAVGRFLNSDITFDTDAGFPGFNLFVYCGCNPVIRVDVFGNESEKVEDCDLADDELELFGAAGFSNASHSMPNASTKSLLKDLLDVLDIIIQSFKDGASGLAGEFRNTPSVTAAPICFVSGTLVKTSDGELPIEEIAVGDTVWAWDEETGDVALKKVVETYINQSDELIHIFVNGEEIITTPTHPFYSPAKGWTDAVQLRAGDILVLVNGEYVVVEKVQHEVLEAPVTVYNFQVEDYHTYFVTNIGVLVHNDCSSKNTTTPWDIHYNSQGSVKTSYHGTDMNAQFDGTYYWLPDKGGHGGSAYKVYTRSHNKLYWAYDADEYGNFINGKHKSDDGKILYVR